MVTACLSRDLDEEAARDLGRDPAAAAAPGGRAVSGLLRR